MFSGLNFVNFQVLTRKPYILTKDPPYFIHELITSEMSARLFMRRNYYSLTLKMVEIDTCLQSDWVSARHSFTPPSLYPSLKTASPNHASSCSMTSPPGSVDFRELIGNEGKIRLQNKFINGQKLLTKTLSRSLIYFFPLLFFPQITYITIYNNSNSKRTPTSFIILHVVESHLFFS